MIGINKQIKRCAAHAWTIGFVRGGMQAVMESNHLDVDWIKMPKDRWFADPFVLDVTNKEILLLVEDYAYATQKGVISLLHIDKVTMEINSRKELLELPTHLSFPAIWRKEGHVYIYPESAHSGRLDIYEYHPESETMTLIQTICDDVVWDSYITETFGEPLMFTAAHNDNILDIYQWNDSTKKFVPHQMIESDGKNSRMGGAVFEYNGAYYYPAQNCEKTYGGSLDIKQIEVNTEKVSVLGIVKHIESPNRRYPLGMHTLNEYKGVVVVDAKGYRYRWLGALVAKMVKLKKMLQHANS